MSIIRIIKDDTHFSASSATFADDRLSWEARGIMGYLLSKPDGWELSKTDLISKGDAGDYKIRRILKELEHNGYLERKREKDENSRFVWVSTIYETPTIPRKPHNGARLSRTIPRLPIDGEPYDIVNSNSNSNSNKLTTDEEVSQPDDNPITAFLKRVPESTRALAEAFCNMHGRPPTDREEKYWRKCWNEQLEIGLNADLIIRAYHYMTTNNLTIKSPGSLNAVAEKIKREGGAVTAQITEGHDFVEMGDIKYPMPRSKKIIN